MNYSETLSYIEESKKYGSVPGLDNIKELLKRLGNPEKRLKAVHVAGTNGKGSVSMFIASVIAHAGYKTGLFTSPAVVGYREIIQINGEWISKKELAEVFSKVKVKADEMEIADMTNYSHPTLFEMETAAALLYFVEKGCDAVVIETGMGGLLDATNVFERVLCSVITQVSIDHTSFLGESIEKIAMQKAGIIKKGCPVVLGIQNNEFEEVVTRVVTKTAKKNGSKLICLKNDMKNVKNKEGYIFVSDNAKENKSKLANSNEIFKLGMQGEFQQMNAAEAYAVIIILKSEGFNISDNDIKAGFENAKLECRFETVYENPRIILDGAHNPGAADVMKKTVEMYFTNEPIVFIMGVLSDKDYERVACIMAPQADKIYTVTPNNARALDGEKLAGTVRKYNPETEYVRDMETAVKKAVETLNTLKMQKNTDEKLTPDGSGCTSDVKAGKTRLNCEYAAGRGAVIVFGSLSYLGEIKKIVKNIISGGN